MFRLVGLWFGMLVRLFRGRQSLLLEKRSSTAGANGVQCRVLEVGKKRFGLEV